MTAKWKQIADELAAEIAAGVRAPGSELPHIRELVRKGRGSTSTVHRAYRDLEDRGYVVSVRGHGTVVRPLRPARVPLYRHSPKKAGGRAIWESAVTEAGLRGQVRAGPPENVPATGETAAALGVRIGAPLLRIRHHVTVGADIIQRDDAWYPLDVAEAAGLDRAEVREADPLGLLARVGLLSGAREHVQAEVVPLVPEEDGEGPELSARGVVLRVDRVTRNGDDHAVEYVSTLADAARVRLSYSLPLNRTGQPGNARKSPSSSSPERE